MTDRESSFLAAARRQPVSRTPIWMMRQAGRSLPEYRRFRERYRLVDIVAQADLCAEVTLQPVRRFGVDAAVMFADIMLPLRGMGVDFELVEDVGPVISNPVRTPADVDRLRTPPAEESVPQILDAIRATVAQSPVPVICFSGAPFTLASYMIEGRPSREMKLTKAFMWSEPAAWNSLLTKLATVAVDYLRKQIGAGASALQLFDSWIGVLARQDYEERVLPHSARIFAETASLGVPRIHFGTGTPGLLDLMGAAGPDVVGLDWRLPLDEGWRQAGEHLGVQGNLDPAILLGPPELIRERALDILRRAGGRPGHIFNLGHGVLPETPLESLQVLIETVHGWDPARA